jgi:phytanoyl-CoA hydroxylase
MLETDRRLRRRFAADGYVALPGFFGGAELDELQGHVARFQRDVMPQLPDEHVFYEDKSDTSSLKQVQQMGLHDAWFGTLLTCGRLPALAELLLDGPVVPRNMQFFDKPPGSGLPTPAHQDGHYFMLEPCDAVTMWLALDPVDEGNGCVRYVQGSHALGLREHERTGTLGFSQGVADFPTQRDVELEVSLPAAPGDLLVHHARTIHRADGNRSGDRHRRALGFIYYGAHVREDAAAHAAYQRELSARMRSEERI